MRPDLRFTSSSSQCVFSYDASQDHNNQRIRRVDIATGATTTLAGTSYDINYGFFDDVGSGSTDGFLDDVGSSAQFSNPLCVAIDPNGTFALVAVRRPPPHPRMPPSRRRHTRLAHGRRIGRTGFHTTLRGQTSGLALPQRVIP